MFQLQVQYLYRQYLEVVDDVGLLFFAFCPEYGTPPFLQNRWEHDLCQPGQQYVPIVPGNHQLAASATALEALLGRPRLDLAVVELVSGTAPDIVAASFCSLALSARSPRASASILAAC